MKGRIDRQQAGLTLIEVLIALAIISIAMTAIIKAVSQSIRATTYLQTKTIALWVGQDVLNKVRVGMLRLPDNADKLEKTTHTLDRDWTWQAYQAQTANKRINKISVRVFVNNDDEEVTPIIHLTSYIYHEK